MKRKTNVQIIKFIMENSRYGALSQMFVIDCLSKFADAVSKSKPSEYENCGVHPQSWIGVAKEIKDILDAHYSPRLKSMETKNENND